VVKSIADEDMARGYDEDVEPSSPLADRCTFYTLVDGKRTEVRVRGDFLNFPEFVQTEADGQWSNNLLALTLCGAPQEAGRGDI
jgi:hypothetical protein